MDHPDRFSSIAQRIDSSNKSWQTHKIEIENTKKLEISKEIAHEALEFGQGNGDGILEDQVPFESFNGCPIDRLNLQLRIAVLKQQLENSSYADAEIFREKLNQAQTELDRVQRLNSIRTDDKPNVKAEN